MGRELPIDLFVIGLFRRAKQAISAVADELTRSHKAVETLAPRRFGGLD